MGNSCCCQSNGPCDSAEETSLLQNDSKTAVPSAETPGALSVEGTCGPGIEEDISKGQINKDVQTETYNAQENGSLQKSNLQTANNSPQQKVNLATPQSVEKCARTTESGDAGHQHSTLITPQMGAAQAGWDACKNASAEEDKAPAQEKCLNGTPAVVCTEHPSLSETTPKQEHSIMDAINNNNEECQVPIDTCEVKPSTELVKEVERPNAEPAALHSQVLPISEINEEVNMANEELLKSVDKDDPETRSSPVCVETSCDETQCHIPETSVGSECSEFDHSSAEGETASSDPHTTATAEESQSVQQECPVKNTFQETAVESSEEDIRPNESVPGVICDEKTEEIVEKVEGASLEVVAVAEEVEAMVDDSELEQQVENAPTTLEGEAAPDESPATPEEAAEDHGDESDEDLYRGAEELSAEMTTTAGASSLSETSLRLDDRCSLAPAVDILSYSQREWKGNTAKSALIRKGYKELSHKFSGVRRVRGDNYCALRATLYQVLCHATQIPEWLHEENVTMLPKELEAQEGLISQWIFPGECLPGDGSMDVTQQLQGYMEQLRQKWQAAVLCGSPSERQQLCEQWFQGGEQELGLMEALKLLMLARAVELHTSIQKGDDPPLFCWLLFARDSSDCPLSFLNNHLSHVGLSAGLEQVEMFLLGYALQCTIQVYRLYKADTEEFVTFYPDDHKDEWPCVCLVTEDDRHYNVPVLLDTADPPKELKSS